MNQKARLSLAIAITSVFVASPVSARLVPIARLPVLGGHSVVNTNTNTLYVGTCQEEACGVVPYHIRSREVLPFVQTNGTPVLFNPLSNSLFAHDNYDVWIMDGDTYEVELFDQSFDVVRIAMNPVGNRLFIAGNQDIPGPHGYLEAVRVKMYEADTHAFLGQRDFLFRQNTALAVDEGKNRLYVSLGDHFPPELAVLDATTMDVITIIPNVPVGTLHTALAINPKTDRIYVNKYNGVNSPHNDNLTVVDTYLNAVVATIEIPNPTSTVVAPRTGKVYVTTQDADMVYVINQDDVLEATIDVGDGIGNQVYAVNPESGSVYVSHEGADYQGIATIDPFRDRVASEIDLGVGCRDIVAYRKLVFAISSEVSSYILRDKRQLFDSLENTRVHSGLDHLSSISSNGSLWSGD